MAARRRLPLTLVSVVLCGLMLAGCGFRPLYGSKSDAPGLAAELASVEVAPIPERTGQLLRNALEQRMERAGGAYRKAYTLELEVDESTEALGLGRDATVTRANLVVTAAFQLRQNGTVIWSGQSRSAAAYNVLTQQYATIASERDSRDRAVTQVADDITRRLAVFLGNRPTQIPYGQTR